MLFLNFRCSDGLVSREPLTEENNSTALPVPVVGSFTPEGGLVLSGAHLEELFYNTGNEIGKYRYWYPTTRSSWLFPLKTPHRFYSDPDPGSVFVSIWIRIRIQIRSLIREVKVRIKKKSNTFKYFKFYKSNSYFS